MKILVTGAAGFIGFHVATSLLRRGDQVVGLDNLNSYYDPGLKEARLAHLSDLAGFNMVRGDLADQSSVRAAFDHKPSRVIHLAAQAGVRYSLTNPHAYIESNVTGALNVLEECRHRGIEHLVYASSSSVYGANTAMPFSVHNGVDHPVSLYAATKKTNELMAHTYSHLYGLPTTGLRFFTVYGPWGRPDMALFLFTAAILNGHPIKVYNHGAMKRDFTYIDDIVEGVVRVLDKPARANIAWSGGLPDPASSSAPYRLYNIGSSAPIDLITFIHTLEEALGKSAKLDLLPIQPGDVPETYADIDDLKRDIGFSPSTELRSGIRRFVSWYRSYYSV